MSKQDTRHRILMAALNLVESGRPPTDLGLREVAREAGIAAPSIYNHFKNMDELGLALLDDRLTRIRSLARQARQKMAGAEVETVINVLMQQFYLYMQKYEPTLRLIIQQWFNPNPEYRNTIRRELAAIRQDLTDNIQHRNNSHDKEQLAIESEAILSLLIVYLIDALDLDNEKRQQRLQRLEKQLLMLVCGSKASAAALDSPQDFPKTRIDT